MGQNRDREAERFTADWPDLAMAFVVALVVLGIPLLTFLFR